MIFDFREDRISSSRNTRRESAPWNKFPCGQSRRSIVATVIPVKFRSLKANFVPRTHACTRAQHRKVALWKPWLCGGTCQALCACTRRKLRQFRNGARPCPTANLNTIISSFIEEYGGNGPPSYPMQFGIYIYIFL